MKGYEHVIYLFLRMCHHLLLCTPNVDGWRMKDQFQNIFLSSDLDNDELKTLIHDCLYMT